MTIDQLPFYRVSHSINLSFCSFLAFCWNSVLGIAEGYQHPVVYVCGLRSSLASLVSFVSLLTRRARSGCYRLCYLLAYELGLLTDCTEIGLMMKSDGEQLAAWWMLLRQLTQLRLGFSTNRRFWSCKYPLLIGLISYYIFCCIGVWGGLGCRSRSYVDVVIGDNLGLRLQSADTRLS